MRTPPHSSQLSPQQFDDVRIMLQDEKDFETAVEMLFNILPDATRDEIVDIANDIERTGEER